MELIQLIQNAACKVKMQVLIAKPKGLVWIIIQIDHQINL
jgi:hypothetical protein